MKKIRFESETDGFHGAFWPTKVKSETVMIVILGDNSEGYMIKCCVKWFHKLGVNVISMSPNKKDHGYHNYPLERIESAILWLKGRGIKKNRNCRWIYNRNFGIDSGFLFP